MEGHFSFLALGVQLARRNCEHKVCVVLVVNDFQCQAALRQNKIRGAWAILTSLKYSSSGSLRASCSHRWLIVLAELMLADSLLLCFSNKASFRHSSSTHVIAMKAIQIKAQSVTYSCPAQRCRCLPRRSPRSPAPPADSSSTPCPPAETTLAIQRPRVSSHYDSHRNQAPASRCER